MKIVKVSVAQLLRSSIYLLIECDISERSASAAVRVDSRSRRQLDSLFVWLNWPQIYRFVRRLFVGGRWKRQRSATTAHATGGNFALGVRRKPCARGGGVNESSVEHRGPHAVQPRAPRPTRITPAATEADGGRRAHVTVYSRLPLQPRASLRHENDANSRQTTLFKSFVIATKPTVDANQRRQNSQTTRRRN